MQVNSISANRPAFKSMSDIETLASLDENQVRQLAYAKTSAEVDDKNIDELVIQFIIQHL